MGRNEGTEEIQIQSIEILEFRLGFQMSDA